MNVLEVADEVVALVGDRAEGQVLVDGTEHALTRFANSFIHQNVAEHGLEVRLKVAVEQRVAVATTTRSDRAGLETLVEEAIAAAKLRPVDQDWPGLGPAAPLGPPARYDAATFASTPDERATRVAAFVAAGDGLQAAGYLDTMGGPTAFANTAGQRLAAESSRATLDGIHQTGTSAGYAHATAAALGDIDGAALGSRAATLARDAADATDVEPAEYEVVLSPECAATMLFFLGFYGWNGKAHLEGQSFVKLGQQQFDGSITIDDDYADPLAVGLPFDADGVPKRRLSIVDRGVSRSVVHDRRTAQRAGATSTAHAIPGGETWGAFPTNLHLRGGDRSVDEMVGSVGRGLFVTSFNYCRILDPRTQVVTGLTRNGTFLIENGEVTRPVTNLRFTQSFVDALGPGRVLGLGNDARMADGEAGPGLCSAPSLHLAGWKFSGGAAG
jgi:predicted Zn-dependent protease